MTSRPRCSKRGSTGKEVGPAAPRKPLGDISALHNQAQPATRKYQKLCTTDVSLEKLPPSRPRNKAAPKKLVVSQPPPRALPEPEPEPENVTMDVKHMDAGSDFEELSSDTSSPHQPNWLRNLPEKNRLALKAMLEDADNARDQKERDLIIRDCCNKFQLDQSNVEDFLEWVAGQDRVSSLSTALKQTVVCGEDSHAGTFSYADDIFDNLLQREERFAIVPDYMENVQRDITHNMRSILVDWLVEVAEEYKLSTQTLFLTVNYIDRLLGLRSINRNKLQLLGITCMLVASKYEEIYPPTIDEFVYISDNTYTRKDVLTMESLLLTALGFNLSAPTAWEFVRSFCLTNNIGDRPKFLAHFLSEIFMMFSCSLKYRPSLVAASAVFLALYTLHLPPWPNGIMRLAGSNQERLEQCVEDLHAVHKKVLSEDHSLKAIKEKFQESKWLRVALIPIRSIELQ